MSKLIHIILQIDLCQKAAHTLKLMGRGISPEKGSVLLSETLDSTVKLVISSNRTSLLATGWCSDVLAPLTTNLDRGPEVRNPFLDKLSP